MAAENSAPGAALGLGSGACRRLIPFALSVCVLCSTAIAQRARSDERRQQDLPRFRSGIELVEVAVSVLDRDGRPVSDLTVADFEVRELGRMQTVVLFDRVEVPPPTGPAIADATAAAASDIATNDFSVERRNFVLIVDDLHIDARITPSLRTLLREVLTKHVGPSDLVALTTTTGRAGFGRPARTDAARG